MKRHIVDLSCKWENREGDDGIIRLVWVPCSDKSCPDRA